MFALRLNTHSKNIFHTNQIPVHNPLMLFLLIDPPLTATLSIIQCHSKSPPKVITGQSRRICCNFELATQVWYSMPLRMLVSYPVLLQYQIKLLKLYPVIPQRYILYNGNWTSWFATCPGTSADTQIFANSFRHYHASMEERIQKNITKHTLPSGKTFATPKGLKNQSGFSSCARRYQFSRRAGEYGYWLCSQHSKISNFNHNWSKKLLDIWHTTFSKVTFRKRFRT